MENILKELPVSFLTLDAFDDMKKFERDQLEPELLSFLMGKAKTKVDLREEL